MENSSSSCRKEEPLIKLVAEIIKQQEAGSALSEQLLGNFLTEKPCDHKYSRLK